MMFGWFLGTVLASLIAPKVLGWWFEPVVPGRPFTCEVEVHWALDRLVMTLFWSGLAGVVVATPLGLLLGRYFSQRSALKAAHERLEKPVTKV